ncbi:glycogen debranching protein [Catalinimonas niigatensis]|uniref:glycogen debranching protein n=1 Tax=Catalinimonas niigatensis TaxID=1397264 RepID=UPI002665B597|nr:isoamylase [Catalinimonas niigatensis]WPP49818.1 isoamylase [Catalinimonas niigatensis]
MTIKSMLSWKATEGSAYPLGVSYVPQEDAYNFALYSKHATSVILSIYGRENFQTPLLRFHLQHLRHKSHRIWHCRIKASLLQEGRYYAYKVDGPEPAGHFEWHAFDKEKVLLDPYARAVFFPAAFDRTIASLPGPNEGHAPLGMIFQDTNPFDWQDDVKPYHEHDLIIYELHVKGFTFHPSSGVAEEQRGTYAGLIEKIPYLKALGITAVELMPVHQFDPQTGDYWGYSTLNFFSPHHAYASQKEEGGQVKEFKQMVKALHQAGIEVILDVVYNHTTEGDRFGPIFSFKGIDNSTYYLIRGDQPEPYCDYTGTGNTLHTRNNYVKTMIIDSLRYWVKEMHIDGFRFDLASIFSRGSDGVLSFEEPPIFADIQSDPLLAHVRFIAEPWDVSGTMQLGAKFPGLQWMQWNGAFRDDVRRFVKGDVGMVPHLMRRLYGSDDLFSDALPYAYHAYQSINFITSHDGFTLYDLLSYNYKHNFANGEHNADGQNENYSWNCGVEGDKELPEHVMKLRIQQAKNFVVLLMLSNGTPMILAGDEFLRTQKGNNNPYNQDNETSWLNWEWMEKHHDFFEFFKNMITFRKDHPSLGRSRFWREDVYWFGTTGTPDLAHHSRSLAFFLSGKSQEDEDIYVMINAYWEALSFTFQAEGMWHRIIDTSQSAHQDFIAKGEEVIHSNTYLLTARSIAVFIRVQDTPEKDQNSR